MSKRLLIALVLLTTGCANRTFMEVGNGTGVPISYVKQRAEEQGITVEDAAQQIGDEMALRDARRGQEEQQTQ